jgi:hypothetical protein
MKLRRRKSHRARATQLAGSYLSLKAAGKATKGAKKAAKGTVAYQLAKRTPVRRVPMIAGAGVGATVAAAFAAKRRRGGGEPAPS